MPQLDGEHRFWEVMAPIIADDERLTRAVHWMIVSTTERESDVQELTELVAEVAEEFGVPYEHRDCMDSALNICEINYRGVI